MRSITFLIVCVGLIGCASEPLATDPDPSRPSIAETQSVDFLRKTAEAQEELRLAEQRGREIFLRGQAALVATDMVTVDTLAKANVLGWVTTREDESWVVRFVGECGESFCSLYRVTLDFISRTADTVPHDTPQELDDALIGSWKARQLALSSSYRRCSDRYNTVVISRDTGGSSEWIVYLLAATTDPKAIIIGGHHRVTVSNDGATILKEEPLSQSCLVMERNPEAVGVGVTHNLHPYPIETHVFASLDYQIPIAVATEKGNYMVEGDEIRLLQVR